MVATIFNSHNLKKWVVCANYGTCLKDWWAQQWDQCPFVLHAGTAISNSSNFIVTTVFNFHNLKKWAACAAILNRLNFMVTTIYSFHNLNKWVGGAHLKDRWAQQWDRCPSILQASTTILNRSKFIVTTVFKFHNLKKWAACTTILNRLNFMLIIYMMVGAEHYLLLTHGKEINGCSRWAP